MADFMSINAAEANHALAMDRMYRLQRHFYDATRAYYLLGRDRLIDELAPPQNGSILEIGCGTGRNIIRAAKRFPAAKLFGLDISDVMLETAGHAIERNNCRARVTLAQADACHFDAARIFGQAQFDRVYFSYTLSMIPDWQAALHQGFKALAPGGEMHVVDFGDCSGLPSLAKTALYTWLRQFHVTPRLKLADVTNQLAAENSATFTFSRPYRGYAILAKLIKQK